MPDPFLCDEGFEVTGCPCEYESKCDYQQGIWGWTCSCGARSFSEKGSCVVCDECGKLYKTTGFGIAAVVK